MCVHRGIWLGLSQGLSPVSIPTHAVANTTAVALWQRLCRSVIYTQRYTMLLSSRLLQLLCHAFCHSVGFFICFPASSAFAFFVNVPPLSFCWLGCLLSCLFCLCFYFQVCLVFLQACLVLNNDTCVFSFIVFNCVFSFIVFTVEPHPFVSKNVCVCVCMHVYMYALACMCVWMHAWNWIQKEKERGLGSGVVDGFYGNLQGFRIVYRFCGLSLSSFYHDIYHAPAFLS